MNQRSKSRALLQYFVTSLGWLILMTCWVLLIAPYADPQCYTSASFGFLPVAMVVPFLVLPLYAISVAAHAAFAFYQRRFDAREQNGVPLFGFDALFFIPFSVVSLIAFAPATHWDKSLHCFFMTCAITLPWIITPIVNGRLLAWKG